MRKIIKFLFCNALINVHINLEDVANTALKLTPRASSSNSRYELGNVSAVVLGLWKSQQRSKNEGMAAALDAGVKLLKQDITVCCDQAGA